MNSTPSISVSTRQLAVNQLSLFVLLVTLTMPPAVAQKFGPWRFVKTMAGKIVNDTASPARPRLLVYPTATFAPETNLELGISSLYLYHAKNKFRQNRLSEVNAFTFLTLRGQYGLNIDHALYSDEDNWFVLGRARVQYFPLLYYGIGPRTTPDNPATVDAFSILLRERLLRKIRPNVFGGLQIDYQNLSRVQFIQPEKNALPLPVGSNGSANLGLGLGAVYDNRRNVLNVRKGLFAEVAYLKYSPAWGSSLSFGSLNVDARLFQTVRPKQVLAAQVFGQFMTGNVPFNQLALVGGETIMRGYYTGRFRDNHYVAAQVEYRWLPFGFSRRIGGAVFAAAGAVAPRFEAAQFQKLLPSGGAGLRYLLFPKKDVFVRFDLGFTREGTGFYIFTGESF